MSKRLALVSWVLGSAAVLAFAAVLLLSELGSTADAGARPATPRDDRDPESGGDFARRSSAGSRGRLLARTFAAGDDDPSTARSPNGRVIEIEIVRADNGEPLPQAEVSWWPTSAEFDGAQDFQGWLARSSVEDHAETAVRLQADARGRVRVPDRDLGFVIAAASADLWGYASFGVERETPAKVMLAPSRDLRVQVVDERNSPVVDAPVALRQEMGTSHLDRATARTRAPDGIAVLRHVDRFLRLPPERNAAFAVAALGLFDQPVQHAIDRDHLPTGVVKLVLRSTGSCEITAVDHSGQVVLGALHARLRFADYDSKTLRAGPPAVESLDSAVGGRVVFDHVALGHSLVVEVTHEACETPLEIKGQGPERPGERVRLQARIGEGLAVLRGRMLDPTGQAYGNTIAYARLEPGDPECQLEGTMGTWTVRTDREGRFCVITPSAPDVRDVKLAVYRLSDRGDEAVAVARRALAREMSAGVHDLGDFVLADVPSVAEGEVVDGEGRPAPGAEVLPSLPATASDSGALRCPPRLQRCTTDARGRFEIRGECSEKSLELVARKGEQVGTAVTVKTGERNVRLFLGAAGSIEGRVLLDASVPAAKVIVEATPEGGAKGGPAAAGGKPAGLGADGRIALAGLVPGSYVVRVRWGPHEIGAVQGVAVQAGKPARDPRLDPLDLRATCRLLTLEVVDERGDAVAQARGSSRRSGEAGAPWTPCDVEGDRVQVLDLGSQGVDVTIGAPAFLDAELRGVTASRRVVLRRSTVVRVKLAEGLAAPEPPLSLGVTLKPSKGEGAFAEGNTVAIDAKGAAVLRPAFSGEARVTLALSSSDGGEPVAIEVEPATVMIGGDGGELEVVIRFDAGRLEEAVRKIRGK